MAKRPGPKGPRKVTKEVSRFRDRPPGAAGRPCRRRGYWRRFTPRLASSSTDARFEKARARSALKKTLAADAHPAGPSRLAAARAATHYERLRGRWMETATTESGPTGERFVRWRLVGLLDAVPPPRHYVVEIHGTRRGEPSPALFAAAARRAAGPKTAPQGPLNAHAPAPTPEVTMEFR